MAMAAIDFHCARKNPPFIYTSLKEIAKAAQEFVTSEPKSTNPSLAQSGHTFIGSLSTEGARLNLWFNPAK